MIKQTKKQRRENEIVASVKTVGLEKFRHYATPRGIYMKESTYGVRKIVHNGKISHREAVEAIMSDPESGDQIAGWIINLGGKQRKFVTLKQGYRVI